MNAGSISAIIGGAFILGAAIVGLRLRHRHAEKRRQAERVRENLQSRLDTLTRALQILILDGAWCSMPRRFDSQNCLTSARERKTELMNLSTNPNLTNHERHVIWDAERLHDTIWNFRRGSGPRFGKPSSTGRGHPAWRNQGPHQRIEAYLISSPDRRAPLRPCESSASLARFPITQPRSPTGSRKPHV